MFSQIHLPTCSPGQVGLDILCDIWRAEAKQRPHGFLYVQKIGPESPGSVVAHPCCPSLSDLGQQAGMQLLQFPWDSPLTSPSAVRLEAVRRDRHSVPACHSGF